MPNTLLLANFRQVAQDALEISKAVQKEFTRVKRLPFLERIEFAFLFGPGRWRRQNHRFKFAVGQKVEPKRPNWGWLGHGPFIIRGHELDAFYGDQYIYEESNGKNATTFKSNIEDRYKVVKIHSPNP